VELVWTRTALARLDEIADYIAADNPEAAKRWIARLRARAEKAAFMPQAGRIVPECGLPNVREVFERTYRIVYRIGDDAIHVLTVFDGRRLLRLEEL
jgi:plasmid stabilization system protein ParE